MLPQGKTRLPWILTVGQIVGLLFLLNGRTSDAALQCYKCSIVSNPDCVDNFPPKNSTDDELKEMNGLVQCQENDKGCIIYEYDDYILNKTTGQNSTVRMKGQRCICQSEIHCLGLQMKPLELDENTTGMVNFPEFHTCMDHYWTLQNDQDLNDKTREEAIIPNQQYHAEANNITNGTGIGLSLTNISIFYCQEDKCNVYKMEMIEALAAAPGVTPLLLIVMIFLVQVANL